MINPDIKKIGLCIVISLFIFPSISIADTYYICDCGAGADAGCVAGSDGNNGLSPQVPWQTYLKARNTFASMQAGETIAFCRGGSFDASYSRWINANCQAENPCIVRDYDPGGNPGRPILTNLSGGIFNFDNNAGYVAGINIMNLELHGGGAGFAFFFYNGIHDVLIDNLLIDGFSIGIHSAGSGPANRRITVKNSRIINNDDQGWLGTCNDCLIENNHFENNGFGMANLNHNVYIGGHNGPGGGIVRGNTLYKSTLVGGKCSGVSLIVHGEYDGLIIENNHVYEDIGTANQGCWGIVVNGGYSSAEFFDNIIIRKNIVENVGNVSIGCQACTNTIIENNIIVNNQSFNVHGIAVPSNASGAGDTQTTDVTIRNNTVYMNTRGTGISFGALGDNNGTDTFTQM